MLKERSRRALLWSGSGALIAVSTGWAMYREISTFGRVEPIATGMDFANNTWRAVRGLFSGVNIYAPTHAMIPGMGPAWPVSQHVPASLLWQAPFAALPLPAGVFAFAFASILAIWVAVFALARPRNPSAAMLAAGCGAFAIYLGGGPFTLLLGQPTAFMLLGLAVLVRARRPWVAGLGFMLAASTLQTGLPLALALLLLGGWPTLWRGVALICACSVPPASLEIANSGFGGFLSAFISGAGEHATVLSNRIDLGALLHRLGATNVGIQVGAGVAVAALSLAFIARLPPHLRRLDNPPVLCLVIAFTLLCCYHQPYDMIFVGGAVLPLLLIVDRSRAMLPVFGFGGVAAGVSNITVALVIDPVALTAVGLFSALALRRAMRSSGGADPSREDDDGLDAAAPVAPGVGDGGRQAAPAPGALR